MPVMYVNTLEAKEDLSELLNRALHHKQRVIITRREKEIAALVPLEDLIRIQSLESQNDLQEAVNALKEARHYGTVTLDELKEEIG